MTPEHVKKILPIITAYADGKTIQLNQGTPEKPIWVDLKIAPMFKGPLEAYRIKPLDHPDVQFDSEDKLLPPAHGKWAAPELTRDKVPEGMRPYLYGEKLRKGDLLRNEQGRESTIIHYEGDKAEQLVEMHEDTQLCAFTSEPLPPKPEPVLMTVDDLPPVVWLLDTCGSWRLVYAVKENGDLDIRFSRGDISWFHKNGFQWSPDRKNPQSFLKA